MRRTLPVAQRLVIDICEACTEDIEGMVMQEGKCLKRGLQRGTKSGVYLDVCV